MDLILLFMPSTAGGELQDAAAGGAGAAMAEPDRVQPWEPVAAAVGEYGAANCRVADASRVALCWQTKIR